MQNIVYSFVAILACVTGLNAQSSVWKISKGDASVYLGGTCHILRKSDYPLPKEFEQAYAEADSLVFEIDPASLEHIAER